MLGEQLKKEIDRLSDEQLKKVNEIDSQTAQLLQIMNEISDEAQRRGLTQAILDSILNELSTEICIYEHRECYAEQVL